MTKGLVFIVFVYIIALSNAFGQEIELSPKHQTKLAEITDNYERALKYQKYYHKDSIKLTKRLKKEAKKLAKHTANENLNNIGEYQQGMAIIDEAKKGIVNLPTDSTDILEKGKKITQSKLSEQTEIEVPDISIDSTTTDKLKNSTVKEGEKLLKESTEYKELSGLEGD